MEFVFVVKRRDLPPWSLPDGFARLEVNRANALLQHLGSHGFFVERAHAELDPDLKQVIPYCLVASKGSVLTVRRLRKQSEKRLHGLWSIGIGGHIEPEDAKPPVQNRSSTENRSFSRHGTDLFERAALRELHEELVCPEDVSPRLIGWLNDDSNDVGKVHLGIVYRLSIAEQDVGIRETERMEGGFFALGEISSQERDLESWSRLIIEGFHPRELGIASR